MTVGQISPIDVCLVTIDLSFGDGVVDFLAIFILRQVSEAVLPVVCLRHGLVFEFLSVLQQLNVDACWANAILVVGVVPSLRPRNLRGGRRVGVDQVVAGNLLIVASHIIFIDCISNLLPVLVDWQVIEAVLPLIGCSHLLGLNLGAVSEQLNGDTAWPLAVLVVGVFPGLGPGHLRRFWSVGVGYGTTLN